MGVNFARGCHAGMTKPRRHGLQIRTRRDQQRSIGVPQRVQRNIGQIVFFDEPRKPARNGVRVYRRAIPRGEHAPARLPLVAKLQRLPPLPCAKSPQCLHCIGRHFDTAP